MDNDRSAGTKPTNRRLLIQALWALVVVSALILFIILIPINIRATRISIEVERVMNVLHPYLSIHSFSIYLVSLRYFAAAAFFSAGAVIFWRCRDEGVAVVFSMLLFLLPVGFNLGSNVEIISPTDLRGTVLAAASGALAAVSWISFVILLFVFPDGRPIPAWTRSWRLLAFAGGAALTLLLSVTWFSDDDLFWVAFLPITVPILILLAAGVGGQIHRYRVISSPSQKQQTKWVVIGLLAYLQWELAPWWWWLQQSEAPHAILVRIHLDILFPLLLPMAVVFSMLRFRLWDVDSLIRRSMIYGALTAVLATLYLASIILLQRLMPTQTQLSTVLSTLIIAALFHPVRRRIQGLIDLRFYRQKYDAQIVLSEFSSTLRNQVDLNRLQEAIIGAVEMTLKPTSISLWVQNVHLSSDETGITLIPPNPGSRRLQPDSREPLPGGR